MEGKAAPAFTLPLADGGEFVLADHVGKEIVVLDFWASWCGPCCMALPKMNALSGQYKDKAVVFCAVNIGEDASTVQAFLKKEGLTLPVALDTAGAVSSKFSVQSIPRLMIIDTKGTVRHGHTGYSPNMQETLKNQLDALLAEATQEPAV